MMEKLFSKTALRLTLYNVIPLFVLLLLIPDLFNAINYPGSYPFGYSINSQYSIYVSQDVYVGYSLIHIIALLLLIVLSFFYKRYKAFYFAALVINIVLLLYPILTTRD